jgi:nitrogenase molybdenum-iron protein alpha chain
MGGDNKLRAAIYRVYRKYKPEVIFVAGTPIVAINNDDVSSVILELEEELDVRILSVYTDGFKSKAGINGIDIVLHTIGRELIQQGKEDEKENFINLISITENQYSIKELLRLFDSLDVKVNLLPGFGSIDNIRNAHLAKASVAVNADEADVLLEVLREKAKVPVIHSKAPIGVIHTMEWLKKIGKQLHLQEKVSALIAKEEERIEKYISKQPLRGKTVYIEAPIYVAVSLAGLVEELGGEVTGLSIDHVDPFNCASLKGLPENLQIKVGEGQPFELVNILLKNKPDYYVGISAHAPLVGKIGILPISLENKILYGYEGVLELIQCFQKAEKRRGLVNYLTENTELSYTQSWANKSVNGTLSRR